MPRSSGLGKGLSSIIPGAELDKDAVRPAAPERRSSRSPSRRSARTRTSRGCTSTRRACSSSRRRSPRWGCCSRSWCGRSTDGNYEIIAGERRWRAAQRAGLATVPAIVRTTDDLSSIEQALVENLHREDLTPLEEAAAYQQLIEDFHLTHEQLSARVGKSRSAITNTLRLLGLPAECATPARRRPTVGRPRPGPARHPRPGTAGAAGPRGGRRELVGAGHRASRSARRRGADRPTRSCRRRNDERSTARPVARSTVRACIPQTRLRPPGLLELEELLADRLETRVAVQMGAKRGRVVIDFADLGDLERIYHSDGTWVRR